MPAVQPLHLPRVERRLDRLGAACTSCGAKGWLADDGDHRPDVDVSAAPVTTPRSRRTPALARCRLDYCNACDSVTMIDESPGR